MRKILLGLLLCASFSTLAATPSIKEDAKALLEKYAGIDSVDWYNKGDTAFAENDGTFIAGRRIKVSVRNDEVNLKMFFVSGPKVPDSEDFAHTTTGVCLSVMENLLLPEKAKENLSWDDEPTPSPLDFMYFKNLQDVFGENVSKVVNGWNVKIKRTVMLTTCSAKKV